MITNPHKKRHIALLISSAFLAYGNQAYALQELSDFVMSQTDAQDGINMTTAYDQIDIARVYWQDKVGEVSGADTTYGLYLDGVTVKKSNIANPDLGATYKIDFSTVGANAGLTFDLTSYFDTMSVNSFKICNSVGASCGSTFGAFTVQQSSTLPMSFKLATTDGLLNLNSVADLEIGIKNFNLYLTQQTSTLINNQFIAKDFNFNFKGKGYIGIDAARGIVLETGSTAGNYVDLIKVADPLYPTKFKAGLNLEFVYKAGATTGVFDTTGAQGVLHLGASGRVTNASIEFRGASNATDSNILGVAYSGADAPSATQIMGSSGLKMRMKADFTKDDTVASSGGLPAGGKGVTLELGHAGTNAYGIEFSNLIPLLVRTTVAAGGSPLNTNSAYFDSGDVYINLANTKRLQMPVNTVLNAARFKTSTLTANADYSHLVHNSGTNPNELTVAVRGFEFQALSRSSQFMVSNDVTNPADIPTNPSQTWGLGLPIYNLNANIATYGTTTGTGAQAIGFGLGLSTEGRNASGSKSTSILLIDGKPNTNDSNNPTNYYLGLRNIDMLITANGVMDLEGGKIHINMPKLTIAAAMELAAGYLPGSRYSTNFTGCTGANELACYVPLNNFTQSTDVFLGLKLRLDGSMDLSIVPGIDTLAGNRLSFEGNYNLTGGAIQVSDPVDGSILGFDNLTGNIGFNNQIKVNKDSVDFNYAFTVNPNHSTDGVLRPSDLSGVFRVKDVNLYPPISGVGQRLGEFAITGGTLITRMNIKPRD
ncbi:MAG: hypothetical protein Q7S87_08115 [Agitococcus sp.]|nr:hypothetical protein [Agitococcus sp.]